MHTRGSRGRLPHRENNDLNNRAFETSPAQCSLWNGKQSRVLADARRVLIASPDRLLGASLVSLFELKSFPSQLAVDAASIRHQVEAWRPQVLFVDTRIGACGNYAMIRALRQEEHDEDTRLIIAMSGFLPDEPIALLKDAGYDGHCRRPCPIWQMTDLLDAFFDSHAVR
jgi:CheY-like chemotaxis protein